MKKKRDTEDVDLNLLDEVERASNLDRSQILAETINQIGGATGFAKLMAQMIEHGESANVRNQASKYFLDMLKEDDASRVNVSRLSYDDLFGLVRHVLAVPCQCPRCGWTPGSLDQPAEEAVNGPDP